MYEMIKRRPKSEELGAIMPREPHAMRQNTDLNVNLNSNI